MIYFLSNIIYPRTWDILIPMPPRSEGGDDTGALEHAHERLYKPQMNIPNARAPLQPPEDSELPHAWDENLPTTVPITMQRGKRHIRLAGVFFMASIAFFIVALGVAGYLFYFGGNSVSVDKIAIDIQGPTTITAGDTVPLSLAIINKNPVAVDNLIVEISFPNGTRSADGKLNAYPRYIENLGQLASGATITRSIKAVIFGGAGQALILPVSISYKTAGSNAVFVKKSSYALAISSTPLSVSVDSPTETVSGKPLTITLSVRSNATVPLDKVVLMGAFPFGFSVTSSSLPFANSSFLIGTMSPGTSKTVTLTGMLLGQNNEQRVFHFTIGTAKAENDRTIAVEYMTQDATVTITAPFINTTLAVNGDIGTNVVIAPNSSQNVTVSYTNTLQTSIANAEISVSISGSAADYGSIQTTSGFYRSTDHTVIFSKDTDPSLAQLAPGDSGIGSFTFSTLPTESFIRSPALTFTISVSGTRIGQTDVPEQVVSSVTKTAKVATTVIFSVSSLHSSGPLSAGGPVPPRVGQATTYTIVLDALNKGSTVADGKASAVLPNYVSYTGSTSGSGSFSYDEGSRTVSWSVGDLIQERRVRGAFQVSFIPSSSQKGDAPALTGETSFSGYDRFAEVQISATANSVTTETTGDAGYTSSNAIVQ